MPLPLAQGEPLLKISRVAITTNDITYADVVASTVSGVKVGERFYGYFPIASHLNVVPQRVTARGFYDGAGHRKLFTSACNQYTRCSQDAGYLPQHEDHQMVVRPLFLTSFMLRAHRRPRAAVDGVSAIAERKRRSCRPVMTATPQTPAWVLPPPAMSAP